MRRIGQGCLFFVSGGYIVWEILLHIAALRQLGNAHLVSASEMLALFGAVALALAGLVGFLRPRASAWLAIFATAFMLPLFVPHLPQLLRAVFSTRWDAVLSFIFLVVSVIVALLTIFVRRHA